MKKQTNPIERVRETGHYLIKCAEQSPKAVTNWDWAVEQFTEALAALNDLSTLKEGEVAVDERRLGALLDELQRQPIAGMALGKGDDVKIVHPHNLKAYLQRREGDSR